MAYPDDSVDAYAGSADLYRAAKFPRRAAAVVGVLALARGAWPGVIARDRNREATRERCASNLKRIGRAILLYANVTRHRELDTFATLVRHGEPVGLATFVCPAGDDARPGDADARDHASYHLTADFLPSMIAFSRPDGGRFLRGNIAGDECVAVEGPGHHGAGVNVLFEDGHVELRPMSERRGETWADPQADVKHNRPIRWPASQPAR